MAQIFVSHSSADNALALQVRSCLGDLGYDSVFLDVSPTDGLVPGAAWRDQLFTNLDRSDAVVFVGTPAANASQWCHSELALTRWLRKPILSLLFDDVDPHELVADIQGLNLASADLSPHLIRGGLVALGLEQAERWDARRSPFPGLRPFDESYAPVFFGRERQVDQLRQLVDPPGRARQGVVVPVLGPSGSGKSSLVRAGLVAALRPAPDWVVSDPWTPSDAPLAELSLALAHAAKRYEVALDADDCRDLLTAAGGMTEYLRKLRQDGAVPADARVLVVVDQAEELVTLTAESERQAFLEALALSCTPPSPLRVVMTARTDMWDSVSALTNRFEMTVATAVLHVPPLTRADLARVIAEPAKRSHLALEDGLLQRLVEDTESGDALPLLAYTLQRMTTLAKDGQLTHALYDGVGGVRGAIASRAGEVAHGTRSQAEVAAAILHIVGTGEGRPVTRLARLDTVPAAQREILDDLVDARLVVIRESAGQQVYAPAHEALFSAWPPLAEMISNRHDDLRLRSRLERRAADWREAGGGASGLLSGDELDQAATWEERNPDLRTPDITAYVAASSHRARRNRLLRIGTGAVVAGLAIALVAVLLVNARDDRIRAREARVGELRAIAERELVHDPVAAAIALLAAYEVDPDDAELPGLTRQLLRSPARDAITDEDPGAAALAVSVGTHRAVASTTSALGTLVDARTGQVLGTLPSGLAVSVRRDDRVAVFASAGELHTYDLGADEPTELAAFGTGAERTELSPSGALLAAVVDTYIELWDLADPAAPTLLDTWRPPGTAIGAVTVLDDGRVLASSDAATLMMWTPDRADGYREILPAGAIDPDASVSVTNIDVDDAGTRALLGAISTPGNPLVAIESGETVATFQATDPERLGGTTFAGAMSRDGSLAGLFDIAGRGFVFDTASGDLVGRLTGGHTALVNAIDFGQQGELLTAGLDGQVRTWDGAAGSNGGDDPDALCEEFGPRIDEASWQVAMGEVTFRSPCPSGSGEPASEQADLAVAAAELDRPPVRRPARAVFTDRFDGPASPFAVGAVPVGAGSLERSRVGGRYRLGVRGVGPDFQMWSTVKRGLAASASLSVRLRPVSPDARCGLVWADADTLLSVTFAPGSGVGNLTWFSGGTAYGFKSFAGTSGPEAELALVRDRGRVEVRVGASTVFTMRDDVVGDPVDIGLVAVGGGTTCEFDDLVARS